MVFCARNGMWGKWGKGVEPVDTVAPADTTATPVETPAATVDSTVAK